MDMSLGMDIAGYATAQSAVSLQSQVSVSMMAKTLDLQESMGDQLTQMMERSVNPSVGGTIDIRI